jgi:hypothetical protein
LSNEARLECFLHRRHIMKNRRGPFIAVVLLSLFAAFGRSSDAGPDPTAEQPFMSRAEVRQQGAVTVRAAVLTDDESERYFGASLAALSTSRSVSAGISTAAKAFPRSIAVRASTSVSGAVQLIAASLR